MSIRAAKDAIADALEAAGLRVALRIGDITPPVCYLQLGTWGENGAPLAGGLVVTFYVFYIPVRGVDNLNGDCDALDTLNAALAPLASGELTGTRTSLTVQNDTWPCYRADVSTLALTPAEVY